MGNKKISKGNYELDMDEFISGYNKGLREFNNKVVRVYWELEKKGIMILFNLKMEIESEKLEMDMSKEEIELEIKNYIIGVIGE